ncbi:hypothetical protein Tco_1047570 [Tanacetum coccineum]
MLILFLTLKASNSEESPCQGFAAALAVLITGASQSRQHGKSEPLEVSSVVPSTNKLFVAPHHPYFFQLLVKRLDHDISSFLFQCTPSSLWHVLHSDILCDGVNINESLRVLIWSVWVPFPDVGFGSFWLGDVDLLLITFDYELKIFDSLLNNQASGEHS